MPGTEYVGCGPLSASVTMQVEAQWEIAEAMEAQMRGDLTSNARYNRAMEKNEVAKAIARYYDPAKIRERREK